MIKQKHTIITVHKDNYDERICLRINDDEESGGILNLCWLNEKETEKLIQELIKVKEEMTRKRIKIEEIINNTDFAKMYNEFEKRYNPYPVQMSRADAFGNAYAEGLIDKYTYEAAKKYYKNLWYYVGD